MPSQYNLRPMTPKERRDYGFARVRNAAYDAVRNLWDRRQEQGVTQADLVRILDCDPAWLSRNLKGPGNWTLRTFGALVEAMEGEIEISVHALEDGLEHARNFHAYIPFDDPELENNTYDESAGVLHICPAPKRFMSLDPDEPTGAYEPENLTWMRPNHEGT